MSRLVHSHPSLASVSSFSINDNTRACSTSVETHERLSPRETAGMRTYTLRSVTHVNRKGVRNSPDIQTTSLIPFRPVETPEESNPRYQVEIPSKHERVLAV